MPSIQVDFDVFKELTARRTSESMTENDVIRELLGINKKKQDPIAALFTEQPWVCKGTSFPHGSEFRATYKGKLYEGKVVNGALEVNGKRHSSPSSAAVAITGSSVNGWRFWECSLPNSNDWRLIANMRN
ncbi:hypothetical protein [Cycloclasticus sp.]|uniref:hypothetical protein n=1 Tax=Cycloclasticus sp. TaxID=2024830 RepID=UPI000C0FA9F4|nr:hypothetical protein [Cycloclasticus sp.]PHR51580.1 MAG: hypothetical protein COA48_00475 [Cycloclasticus sp.]